MGFYDKIAQGIPWEYSHNVDSYLKVVGGKLQLPNPKWLQYHLYYLDKVIEKIRAFKAGVLVHEEFDLNKIDKKIIWEPAEAKVFLKFLQDNYKEFAIDIESNNLSTDKAKNKILCIGVAYEELKGVSFLAGCFEDKEFRDQFAAFAESNNFILHNAVFDRSRVTILSGYNINVSDDTLLMHYCGINERKGTHSLKDLSMLYLNFPNWEEELDTYKRQFCKDNKIKLSEFQYEYFNPITLAEYNVIDCCATFQLRNVFRKIMRESSLNIYRTLVRATHSYADAIARGMLLDVKYWNELKDKLEGEKERLELDLSILMPGVKPSSPVQLKRFLVQRFPNEIIESTGREDMERLIEKYPTDDALTKLLEYRKNIKYLKTYVYGLWDRKDYNDIIHTEFKLHGTETGRLSSANPNMQNIPRNALIKSLFIARPGYKLLQLDYSQAELRVLAYVSGDEKLIQVYKDGRDLHSEMQAQIFKDEYDHEDKEQRMAAKIINFGIPYGRTVGGVASQLKVDRATARRYLDDWFKAAPAVTKYIKKCHDMALGDVQENYYTIFGRTRTYFITSENVYHVRNQSVNFPITSTANDLTIHSLIEIDDYLKSKGFDAHLVNTVHDSIILEVREKDAEVIADACIKIMRDVPKRYLVNCEVPFEAEAEIGSCWGTLKQPDWEGVDDEDSDD